MIEITSNPISVQMVIDKVRRDNNSDVITFVGTVRDNSEGKRVLYLEYEVYKEMADKKLQEICEEINHRWPTDIAIVHRVGRIDIGEAAVVIAVGSSDQSIGFQACQYAIDRIKEIVPIWKKEFYDDGSRWVGHFL
jgi:molybdopterin synthase catalytic subunit